MGSGLILLVIVGAWLAVLIPMGLRAQDHVLPGEEPEREGMRLLRRRPAHGGAMVLVPVAPQSAVPTQRLDSGSVRIEQPPAPSRLRRVLRAASPGALSRVVRVAGPALSRVPAAAKPVSEGARALLGSRAEPGRPLSPQVRRRRTALVLLALLLFCVVGGLAGPRLLLVVAGLLALGAVAFLAHCRRQALVLSGARRRPATQNRDLSADDDAPLAAPAGTSEQTWEAAGFQGDLSARLPRPRTAPVRVAGIPSRMPARPAPAAAGTAPSEPVDEDGWLPMPVPLPTYMGKATAPVYAPPRTRPQPARPLLRPVRVTVPDDTALDEILDRRIVSGW